MHTPPIQHSGMMRLQTVEWKSAARTPKANGTKKGGAETFCSSTIFLVTLTEFVSWNPIARYLLNCPFSPMPIQVRVARVTNSVTFLPTGTSTLYGEDGPICISYTRSFDPVRRIHFSTCFKHILTTNISGFSFEKDFIAWIIHRLCCSSQSENLSTMENSRFLPL